MFIFMDFNVIHPDLKPWRCRTGAVRRLILSCDAAELKELKSALDSAMARSCHSRGRSAVVCLRLTRKPKVWSYNINGSWNYIICVYCALLRTIVGRVEGGSRYMMVYATWSDAVIHFLVQGTGDYFNLHELYEAQTSTCFSHQLTSTLHINQCIIWIIYA